MNRTGQPQQRGPSLATNQGLAGQFRPPFPTYGMPPRSVNVLQAGGYVPNLQPSNHRTNAQQSQVQTMTPQPTPGFMSARGQSNYAFGGGALGQHQTSGPLQQQQLSSQQTNGTSTTMPPHLSQSSVIGTPSISSGSEVALDPNDFPALGSTTANNPSSSSTATNVGGGTSYASQAGTGVSLLSGAGSGTGTIGGSGSGNQPRDFTPDDFPALVGQSHTNQSQNTSQNQTSSQDSIPHPPGLNGFQQDYQHRRNLIGDLSAGLQQPTPGMLNLGPNQARNVHPGFQQNQPEVEKQQRNNNPLKLSQAAHPAWNSPNPSQPQQAGGNATNGANQTSLASHLNPPPGVPTPTGDATLSTTNPNGSAHPNVATTTATTATQNPPAHVQQQQQHPQTPAQQILVSAADRWGLLSLIALMKNANSELDHGLSSIGTDLGTLGLDMAFPGNLYSTFITPWADPSAVQQVEPDFQLPSCYLSVQAAPPGPAKAALFSDETLFFMFYSSPRDALQEVAAQELWNRNWRWHKDHRLWITKENGASISQKVPGGEQGFYTYWDPESWAKERKEMTVLYADLEEKSTPAFAHGPGLVLAQPNTLGQGQTPVQQTVQTAQLGAQLANQIPTAHRGSFQMGVAA